MKQLLSLQMPIRIQSTLNQREHWAKRAKRAKAQRWETYEACRFFGGGRAKRADPFPCTVKLIRIAPRELDTDNLAGGFKSVRDGIADWLGINDNDPRVRWEYGQAKGKPKEYACRIEFLTDAEGAVASLRQMGAGHAG